MSTRNYQIALVDAERKAQLARRPETGFSKETELILQTSIGKRLFFGLLMCVVVLVVVLSVTSGGKGEGDKVESYKEIASIIGYLIMGITIGRSLYIYYHPNSPESVGALLWYILFWPVYIFLAGYKFLINNDKDDVKNILKNFIGFRRLPPYPSGTDYLLSNFGVFFRLTIVASLAVVLWKTTAAVNDLSEDTVMYKDFMVLLVVLIILSFITIIPDSVLNTKGWQYRVSIFLAGFFFLYCLNVYYFGNFDTNGRKDNTFAATVASGVLLFAIMIYYFMYNLPDDERTRMLRGIFTDEQMEMINPALASQVRVLEKIVHNSDYFDENDYFTSDPKLLAEIQTQFSPSVFEFVKGKNKASIETLIKDLRKKFTAIYRAKEIYQIALQKYNENGRKDQSIFKSFFNTPEFIALEQDSNPELNALARKFKDSTLANTAVGGFPPVEDYQKLFGTQLASPIQEVVLPKTTTAVFESQIKGVSDFLQGAFNRAVLKILVNKYIAFVKTDAKIGILCDGCEAGLDDENKKIKTSPSSTDRKDSDGAVKNINSIMTDNSKKELQKNSDMKNIYDSSLTFSASDNPAAMAKMAKFIVDNEKTDLDGAYKKILGDKYEKPPVALDIIMERYKKDNLSPETVWNNKLIRNDMQKLGENRRKNIDELFSQNKKFYKALTDLIIKYSQAAAAQDYDAYDLTKENSVIQDIKILNEGIGNHQLFGRGIGDEMFSRARIEAESERKNIQQAYTKAKEVQDEATLEASKLLSVPEYVQKIKDALTAGARETIIAGKVSDGTKRELELSAYGGKIEIAQSDIETIVNAIKDKTTVADARKEFVDEIRKIISKKQLETPTELTEVNKEKESRKTLQELDTLGKIRETNMQDYDINFEKKILRGYLRTADKNRYYFLADGSIYSNTSNIGAAADPKDINEIATKPGEYSLIYVAPKGAVTGKAGTSRENPITGDNAENTSGKGQWYLNKDGVVVLKT